MTTPNTKLYELFTPNLLSVATLVKFKRGEEFYLTDSVGIIVDGVIAVDGYHPDADSLITLRLVTMGGMINIEKIFDQPNLTHRRYVCETSKATLAVIDVKHFKQELNSKSVEVQNIVSQELLSKLLEQLDELTDTTIGISSGTAFDKILWALKRYQRLTIGISTMSILRVRLAVHVGVSAESVSRVLNKLFEAGQIAHRTNATLILKETS